MQIRIWKDLSAREQTQLLARPAATTAARVTELVRTIIAEVASSGDEALLRYRSRFDRAGPDEPLMVPAGRFEEAAGNAPEAVQQALQCAAANIRAFHEPQVASGYRVQTMPGVWCEQHYRPLGTAGLYIPGGSAPLVSTVLMLGIPAMLAGCEHVFLCTPPPVPDEILLAASLCNIRHVFAAGGAQAIAAMAAGTQSVPRADKIFGPGNAWVTEAKLQVSCLPGGPAIDMPAGPSELLVLADETATPCFVAADLLSQAEHDPQAQVLLVSPDVAVMEAVIQALHDQLSTLPRRGVAGQSLAQARFLLGDCVDEALEISNR